MHESELNVFLAAIQFNQWGWFVLGFIVIAAIARWNVLKAKKNGIIEHGKTDWPGDGFANSTTVGKNAASFRKTRSYK